MRVWTVSNIALATAPAMYVTCTCSTYNKFAFNMHGAAMHCLRIVATWTIKTQQMHQQVPYKYQESTKQSTNKSTKRKVTKKDSKKDCSNLMFYYSWYIFGLTSSIHACNMFPHVHINMCFGGDTMQQLHLWKRCSRLHESTVFELGCPPDRQHACFIMITRVYQVPRNMELCSFMHENICHAHQDWVRKKVRNETWHKKTTKKTRKQISKRLQTQIQASSKKDFLKVNEQR